MYWTPLSRSRAERHCGYGRAADRHVLVACASRRPSSEMGGSLLSRLVAPCREIRIRARRWGYIAISCGSVGGHHGPRECGKRQSIAPIWRATWRSHLRDWRTGRVRRGTTATKAKDNREAGCFSRTENCCGRVAGEKSDRFSL